MLVEIFVSTNAYLAYKAMLARYEQSQLLKGMPLHDGVQVSETLPVKEAVKLESVCKSQSIEKLPTYINLGIPGFGIVLPIDDSILKNSTVTELSFTQRVKPDDSLVTVKDQAIYDMKYPRNDTKLTKTYINDMEACKKVLDEYSIDPQSIPLSFPLRLTRASYPKVPLWETANAVSSNKGLLVQNIIHGRHRTLSTAVCAVAALISGGILAYDAAKDYIRKRSVYT